MPDAAAAAPLAACRLPQMKLSTQRALEEAGFERKRASMGSPLLPSSQAQRVQSPGTCCGGMSSDRTSSSSSALLSLCPPTSAWKACGQPGGWGAWLGKQRPTLRWRHSTCWSCRMQATGWVGALLGNAAGRTSLRADRHPSQLRCQQGAAGGRAGLTSMLKGSALRAARYQVMARGKLSWASCTRLHAGSGAAWTAAA